MTVLDDILGSNTTSSVTSTTLPQNTSTNQVMIGIAVVIFVIIAVIVMSEK